MITRTAPIHKRYQGHLLQSPCSIGSLELLDQASVLVPRVYASRRCGVMIGPWLLHQSPSFIPIVHLLHSVPSGTCHTSRSLTSLASMVMIEKAKTESRKRRGG